MVIRITTREQLESIVDAGHGYLYNDFGGRDPRYCPIHRVGACNQLGRMLAVRPGPLRVGKLWSEDLAQLVAEVERLGKVHVMCGAEREVSVPARGSFVGAPRLGRSATPARPTIPAEAPPKHELLAEPCSVRMWSVERLPYEPKGAMQQARDDLARALRELAVESH